MTAVLHLYFRAGCDLCEDMHIHLLELQPEYPFELHCFDIDADVELKQRFNTRVPVLIGISPDQCTQTELCDYYLDQAGLLEYLRTYPI